MADRKSTQRKTRERKGERRQARASVGARPAAQTIAVGDQVRMPLQAANLYTNYGRSREAGEFPTEPIEGLVCSIRDVRTGQLVPMATGNLDQYVFELLHSHTFHPRFSSEHNAGGARVPRPVQEYDRWKRVRQALREATQRGERLSHATGALPQAVLDQLLQGWRLVKVRSAALESTEAEVAGPTVRPVVIEEAPEREIEYERPERRI